MEKWSNSDRGWVGVNLSTFKLRLHRNNSEELLTCHGECLRWLSDASHVYDNGC